MREYKTLSKIEKGLENGDAQVFADLYVLVLLIDVDKPPYNTEGFHELFDFKDETLPKIYENNQAANINITFDEVTATANWINAINTERTNFANKSKSLLWQSAYLFKTVSDKLTGGISAMPLNLKNLANIAYVFFGALDYSLRYISLNLLYDVLAKQYGLKNIKDLKYDLSKIQDAVTPIEYEQLELSKVEKRFSLETSNDLTKEFKFLETTSQLTDLPENENIEQLFNELIHIDFSNIIHGFFNFYEKHNRWAINMAERTAKLTMFEDPEGSENYSFGAKIPNNTALYNFSINRLATDLKDNILNKIKRDGLYD